MKCKTLCSLVLALTLASSHEARALDFYFEFTNTGTSASAIEGTVTGAIYGLENDTAVAPSDIVIFTLPAALQTVVGFGDNTSLTAQGWNLSGTIPVVSGSIPNGTYIYVPSGDASASLGLNQGLYAFLGNGDGSVYRGGLGFSISPLAPVPEPSQYGLALFLAAAAVFAGRRYVIRG